MEVHDGGPGLSPGWSEAAGELAARLRTVIGRLARSFRRTQAGADLTTTQHSVLALTVARGPIGLGDLAREEGLNPTLLSRAIRRLEEGGLVLRRADPEDRRVGVLEPTHRGRRLNERIRTERTGALIAALQALDAEQRRVLADALPVLEQIARTMKAARR